MRDRNWTRRDLLKASTADLQLHLAWQQTQGVNQGISSSPTVANGVVYYGDGYGNELFALSGSSGAVLWRSGSAKWAQWIGEGKALMDAATAMYLSLESLEKKGFLTLTVPSDLLAADNLSRFQTTYKEK